MTPTDPPLPFDAYPHRGRALLGRAPGGTARRHYGLRLQQLTGQTRCAYCGVDLVTDYHRWLLLTVDHVVPVEEAKRLGIPPAFAGDYANLVIACSACNGFGNRYQVPALPQATWTLEEFFALRDRVFIERRDRIADRRDSEIAYFETRPWLPPGKARHGPATSEGTIPTVATHVDTDRRQVVGVDFSGGEDAGRKVWVATARIDGERLVVEECRRADALPGSGRGRMACLAALRSFIAGAGAAVVGLDFPFSLPRSLVPDPTWEAFAIGFAVRYPDAEAFRRQCAEQAMAKTGKTELRRQTDVAARTPFAAYNLRLYRQTYYGIRDVLAPLVAAGAVSVLPMHPIDSDRPWLVEICPASTLKRLGLVRPYKGRVLAAAREALLAAVKAAVPVTVPPAVMALAVADPEGDALDAVVAAAAAFRSLRDGSLATPATDEEHLIEGFVYT